MSEGALLDVKVIDLTWYIAGPYCTKLLADYGADVVKIEKPGGGDPSRSMRPFFEDDPHPEKSGPFLFLNTNKRGITLNLKTSIGKKIFKELIRDADLLVESFRPRVMPRLGLSYEVLQQINPRLVMTSISTFGQTGPYRDFQSSELVLNAMGRDMFSVGLPESYPLKHGNNCQQFLGGSYAAVAAMGALIGARTQGIGQQIDVSMVESLAGGAEWRSSTILAYQYAGETQDRELAFGQMVLPSGTYPCKDSFIRIYMLPQWFPAFAKLVGRPDLIEDPRFQGFGLFDMSNKGEMEAIFINWLMEHDKQEAMELGQALGIGISAVNTTKDVFEDQHLMERDYWVEIVHPGTGKLRYPGPPFRMLQSPSQVRRPAPLLGQHNAEVYGQLGYSKGDLVMLRQMGAI